MTLPITAEQVQLFLMIYTVTMACISWAALAIGYKMIYDVIHKSKQKQEPDNENTI